VRAYAINELGVSYGEQVAFMTVANSFTCGTTYIDNRDNYTYTTVQIVNQFWMQETMRYLLSVHNNTEFYDAGFLCASNSGVQGCTWLRFFTYHSPYILKHQLCCGTDFYVRCVKNSYLFNLLFLFSLYQMGL
jgi:hypothetical protein